MTMKGFLLLFVYGTLKRGQRNHPILLGEKYLGDAITSPNYTLVDLGDYPGMIEKPFGGLAVRGEIFEIPSELLIELDKIEDSPSLFNLEPITLADGSSAFSYMYKQSIEGARILSEGVWPV